MVCCNISKQILPKSKQGDLSILKEVSSAHEEKECLKNGLRILAKIIIRKYIDENIKKEGDKNNEENCSKRTICYK